MAKMFYTLPEAAQRLGRSEDEVRRMIESGQLQEFRDRNELVVKVEQVDLLARGEGDDDIIPLAEETGEGMSLAESGTGIGLAADSGLGLSSDLEGSKARSGISIFEADDLDEADPSAQTQISAGPGLQSEQISGSGSGLLDLTREADDTSLGADLLEGVYSGQDEGMSGTAAETGGGAGLFETTSAASDVSAGPAVLPLATMQTEAFDGAFSGFTAGAFLAVVLLLGVVTAVIVMAMTGFTGGLLTSLSENFMVFIGAGVGAVLIIGVVGLLIGRKG